MNTLQHWFAYPPALTLLLSLPLLGNLALLAWLARRRGWRMLGGLAALQTLSTRRPGRRMLRGFLTALGLLLVGIAAAGPQWGPHETEVKGAARDLVVVLDVSRSMLAEVPSRQLRGRRILADLANTLQERGGHRVALVVCAAKAQLVLPLTTDYDLFRDAVLRQDAGRLPPELRPGKDGPASGTRLGEGVQTAIATHDPEYRGSQVILLVSDGDDPVDDGEWKDGATAARRAGIPVFTVGVGDPTRPSKIRLPDGTLLLHEGKPVETRLEEKVLKEIAQRTDGSYFPLRTDDAVPGTLFPAILQAAAALPRQAPPVADLQPRFRWFFAAGLLCLAGTLLVSDRRAPRRVVREGETTMTPSRPETARPGLLAAATIVVALLLVGAAPQTPDDVLRRGNEAAERKDYDAALRLYEQAEASAADPGLVAFNKGTVLFRLGRYREAELCYLRCLQDRDIAPERRCKALYDLGVCLMQRGAEAREADPLARAAESFELCRRETPDAKLRDDAEHNLELARLLWRKVQAETKADDKGKEQDGGNEPDAKKQGKSNAAADDGGKDPSGPGSERVQPGDRKANETDKKIPGAGNIQTLPDSEQLQAMDANDALERLAREIRRIERQQQPAQGPRAEGDPLIRDW